MLGSIFYRIHHCLRTVSGAIHLRTRERGRCYPRMQRNQCLEEWFILMCKTCGKKRFRAIYLFNSLIQLNSKMRRHKNKLKISMSYTFVVFDYQNTTSCGSRRCFRNFNVHNLFIDDFSDKHFFSFYMTKRGEYFPLPSPLNDYKT
jgi:hypothetical protein